MAFSLFIAAHIQTKQFPDPDFWRENFSREIGYHTTYKKDALNAFCYSKMQAFHGDCENNSDQGYQVSPYKDLVPYKNKLMHDFNCVTAVALCSLRRGILKRVEQCLDNISYECTNDLFMFMWMFEIALCIEIDVCAPLIPSIDNLLAEHRLHAHVIRTTQRQLEASLISQSVPSGGSVELQYDDTDTFFNFTPTDINIQLEALARCLYPRPLNTLCFVDEKL